MKQVIDAQWLASRVESPRTEGIVVSLSRLIASGNLDDGAQLPTVRELAQSMHVSPSTVMNAWQKLRAQGLIETHRRGGTVVSYKSRTEKQVSPGSAHRSTTQRDALAWSTTDFSRGSADPALQPDLGRALTAGLRVDHLHESERENMVGALLDAVAPTWPVVPQAWTTAGGGTEGMLLALQAATRPGDKVAIENPTSPRLLGVLATLDLTPVPVDCDDEGPLPDFLQAALRERPTAFVYQIRAHVPAGHALSERRRDALAAILGPHPDVSVMEDDHLGYVTSTPVHSMALRLPSRCLLVRAYCRAFGVDLRTSVIGGSQALIDRIDDFRNSRVAMTSRILQGALAFLLSNPESVATLEHARQCYASRRRIFVAALRDHGLDVIDGSGLIVWIPVPNESKAIVNLATAGVIVAGGASCFVDRRHDPHIRISISRLPDDAATIEGLAQTVAGAIHHPTREEYD